MAEQYLYYPKPEDIQYTDEEVRAIIAGERPIIKFVTDNDLYEFTMQQFMMFAKSSDENKPYREMRTVFRFVNRGNTPVPDGFADAFNRQIKLLGKLSLTPWERARMLVKIPALKSEYLDYLEGNPYKPEEVHAYQVGNEFCLELVGFGWSNLILEVPCMSICSQLYFHMTGQKPDFEIFISNLERKTNNFNSVQAPIIDFGTRRRASFRVHETAVRYLKAHCPTFLGTSNVYIGLKHDLKIFGTNAHLLYMLHMAMFGVENANRETLEAWYRFYQGELGIALTDTFTTQHFFSVFNKILAKIFNGVRQDSGDPDVFGENMIAHYLKVDVDPTGKLLLFSDGLDDEKVVELMPKYCTRTKPIFCIGTFISNDCGLKPLKIVIKLTKCRHYKSKAWIWVVKIPDSKGKNHGPKKTIERVKRQLHLS